MCAQAGITTLGVFGSVARGDDNPDESDVDLLARFKTPVGMFELLDLEVRIAEALGRPIDLSTEGSLHPLIRERVKKDLKIIYEA